MSFRTAIVLSLALHLAALAVVYFLPKPQTAEPQKPYIVKLVGPAEQAPVAAAPPPAPTGRPEEAPPAPSPPVPPAQPSRPQPPAAPSPPPAETSPAPAPAPETGPATPSGQPTPPGEGPSAAPSPGGRPGLLRPSDIQDIIDKIAKAPTPSETEGSSITFSTQEYRYKAYMERLKQKIEGVWVYPRSAAEKGIYGDLVIQFTIRKDGSLAKAKVVRTSGYQELDEAAVKALRDGEPYWPLPAGWPEESLTINGHFIYSLWGRYLR